jgi:hypothetical protein
MSLLPQPLVCLDQTFAALLSRATRLVRLPEYHRLMAQQQPPRRVELLLVACGIERDQELVRQTPGVFRHSPGDDLRIGLRARSANVRASSTCTREIATTQGKYGPPLRPPWVTVPGKGPSAMAHLGDQDRRRGNPLARTRLITAGCRFFSAGAIE